MRFVTPIEQKQIERIENELKKIKYERDFDGFTYDDNFFVQYVSQHKNSRDVNCVTIEIKKHKKITIENYDARAYMICHKTSKNFDDIITFIQNLQ